jgi:hypothetical protein
MARNDMATKQDLKHESWETQRRGNFDLVVLGPLPLGRTRPLRVNEFQRGLIKPGVVIEIGLNYDLLHLFQDKTKLKNSQVQHGYLIHLVQQPNRPGTIKQIEESMSKLIEEEKKDPKIKIAYAHLDGTSFRYRKIGDECIKTYPG